MPYIPGVLTGRHYTLDDQPALGYVELIPSVRVIRDLDGNVLLSGRIKAVLDAQGVYRAEVPPTAGDPRVDPQGVTYTAVAKLRHEQLAPVVGIRVEAGQSVDVGDVASIDPEAPTYAAQVKRGEFDDLEDRVHVLELNGGGGGGDGGGAVTWSNVFGKPATFPPSPHTHPVAQIDASDMQDLTLLFENGLI